MGWEKAAQKRRWRRRRGKREKVGTRAKWDLIRCLAADFPLWHIGWMWGDIFPAVRVAAVQATPPRRSPRCPHSIEEVAAAKTASRNAPCHLGQAWGGGLPWEDVGTSLPEWRWRKTKKKEVLPPSPPFASCRVDRVPPPHWHARESWRKANACKKRTMEKTKAAAAATPFPSPPPPPSPLWGNTTLDWARAQRRGGRREGRWQATRRPPPQARMPSPPPPPLLRRAATRHRQCPALPCVANTMAAALWMGWRRWARQREGEKTPATPLCCVGRRRVEERRRGQPVGCRPSCPQWTRATREGPHWPISG